MNDVVQVLVGGVLVVGAAVAVCAVRYELRQAKARSRARAYRKRQAELLQMLREERDRTDARRDRGIAQCVRFGSNQDPRIWRAPRPPSEVPHATRRTDAPPALPFDDDFGGMLASWRSSPATVPDWDAPVAPVVGRGGSFDGGGASADWSDPEPAPAASASTVD